MGVARLHGEPGPACDLSRLEPKLPTRQVPAPMASERTTALFQEHLAIEPGGPGDIAVEELPGTGHRPGIDPSAVCKQSLCSTNYSVGV